jgi:peptide/nickel transport system substrate-binding protein
MFIMAPIEHALCAPPEADYVRLIASTCKPSTPVNYWPGRLADGFLARRQNCRRPPHARRGGAKSSQSQLRDVGITAEIGNLEWAQWIGGL